MAKDTSEQRTARRRWLNLAELVAVAGVVIAALSLYLTYADRRDAAADKMATAASEAKTESRVDLTATVTGGGRSLLLADPKHDLSDVTVAFPKALDVPVQRPAGDPAIDSAPFAPTLLKLTDHGPDARSGRLPVLVTASYVDGDATRTARSLYDVVWRTEGRLLRGRELKLTGLRLRRHGGDQATLDAAWAARSPS